MTNKDVRFADFECVLLRLGFQRKPAVGTQLFYEHTIPETWILLPRYAPDEKVRPLHLLAARRLIAERGLLEASDFDRLIADATPESNAKCAPDEPEALRAAVHSAAPSLQK